MVKEGSPGGREKKTQMEGWTPKVNSVACNMCSESSSWQRFEVGVCMRVCVCSCSMHSLLARLS